MPGEGRTVRISLLGQPKFEGLERNFQRLSEMAHALAYLAYYLGRPIPISEVKERIYTHDAEYYSVKRLLERLRANLQRGCHQIEESFVLDPSVVITDVQEWRSQCLLVKTEGDQDKREEHVAAVIERYGDGLLPYRPMWLAREREQLANEFVNCLVHFLEDSRPSPWSQIIGKIDGVLDRMRNQLPKQPKALARADPSVPIAANRVSRYLWLLAVRGKIPEVEQRLEDLEHLQDSWAWTHDNPFPTPDAGTIRLLLEKRKPSLTDRKFEFPVLAIPVFSGPFIGRQIAQDQVVSLLDARARLLTLTGPGGSGKTRLAAEILKSTSIQTVFGTGRAFIELGEMGDKCQWMQTVAAALQMELGMEDPLEAIITAFNSYSSNEQRQDREGRILLVLDGIDYIVQQASQRIHRLLERVPTVAVCRELDARAYLDQLHSRSMVIISEDGKLRYRLLDTLRQFATERQSQKERREPGRTAIFVVSFAKR